MWSLGSVLGIFYKLAAEEAPNRFQTGPEALPYPSAGSAQCHQAIRWIPARDSRVPNRAKTSSFELWSGFLMDIYSVEC